MSKKITRILCMILTLAMVAAFALVPMVSAASTKTIYFDNSGKNWSTVNVYTWTDGSGEFTGSWPGAKMTKVSGNIYSYEVPANAVNIIFNNGSGAQTANLTIPTDAKNLYNGSAWGIYGQEIEVTYILAGSDTLCGTAWDPSNTANKLTDADGDKVYTIVYPSVVPGTYEFKVTDGSWNNSWGKDGGSDNYVLTLKATSSVEIRFDSVNKTIEVVTNATGAECPHSYVNSVCTLCGALSPDYVREFYLFGWINNADYGCEGDADNMGAYKFVNGKLTVKFEAASYVAVKTTGNVEWFMTTSATTATSATLYTTDKGGCDKMYIPGDVEVVMTLVENADGTLTLSYEAAECTEHRYFSGMPTQPTCTTPGYRTYTCANCGYSYQEITQPATGHSYVDGTCYYCGVAEDGSSNQAYYLFGYINGSDYGWNSDITTLGKYKFVDGKLEVTFTQDSYVGVKTGDNKKFYLTSGYVGQVTSTELVEFDSPNAVSGDRLYIPGGVKVNMTLTTNASGELVLSYTVDASACEHTNHTQAGVCTACGTKVNHTYSMGVCTVCGAQQSDYSPYVYYLYGYINGADYGTGSTPGIYKFVDNKLEVTFDTDSYIALKKIYPNGFGGNQVMGRYMTQSYCTDTTATFYNTETGASEKMFVPGGVKVTFTLVNNGDDTFTLSYTATSCNHNYVETIVTAPTCLTAGQKTLTCSLCAHSYTVSVPATGHSYANGKCTGCGIADPGVAGVSYSIVGYINGANYGCEEDHANPGQYIFVNGKVTVTFTEDSYIFIKTTDSSKWLLANSYTTDSTCTFKVGGSEKMFVPGGKALTFTLTENADGSVTVSYTTASASVVPTLTLKAPALEFKDMITVNAFYPAENTQDVVQMGMITYSSKVSVVDINTAEHVIPGATYDSASGRYFSASQGIHAKYLGDTVYLACYAKLTDGTYVYTKLASYSAVTYATNQLKNSTDAKLKQLVAAMLNYGAAAQNYFGYNTGALANASLTAAQKALPAAYSSSMVQSAPAAPAAKQGTFANNKGFSVRKPAVSFEGAFSINYFFTPAYTPVNGVTLYYWTEADYNAASVLTTANATGAIAMKNEGGQYRGDIEGVAAKDLATAIYVAAVYSDGSTTWTSGVLGYSIGAYCSSQASGTGTMAELAKATAVYGYHAKAYFG